jgi:hypothetical protein
MKVAIENLGDHPVRIVVDHDTVNDFVLDPGAADGYETAEDGVIELRELGGADATDEAGEAAEEHH